MQLVIAENIGFCFGVERAVRMTEQALEEHGSCWCLGELIHNKDAVRVLAEKGLKTAESVEDVPAGAVVAGVPGRVIKYKDEKTAVYSQKPLSACQTSPSHSRLHIQKVCGHTLQ